MQNPDMHAVLVNVDPSLNVSLIIPKNLLPNYSVPISKVKDVVENGI